MASESKPARRPIRIAMVHYRDSADAGGSLRVGETIANQLDPNRVSAQLVFAYGGAGPVARQAKVPCHFIGASGPRDFPKWVRARTLFRTLRPDVIHFQDGIVWLRGALLGVPSQKLLHVHGRYEQNSNRALDDRHQFDATFLLRKYLRFTDAQVCISIGARDALLNLGWVSPERSYVVYNAIDVPRFSAQLNSTEARARFDLPRNALLLGIICRLVPEKGCLEFLSIIERLPNRWHGVICGDGPQRRELQNRCAALGITGRIHFLNCQDDVRPVYAAIDAYAFLSSYEPFGLVAAEAMACEVPVFGVMRDGEYAESDYPLVRSDTALMIPRGADDSAAHLSAQTIENFTRHLSHFADCPEAYTTMVEKARRWVTNCFAAPVQAEAMTKVYEHICSRAARPALADWYEGQRREAERLLDSSRQQQAVAATA